MYIKDFFSPTFDLETAKQEFCNLSKDERFRFLIKTERLLTLVQRDAHKRPWYEIKKAREAIRRLEAVVGIHA
jgi:hypothetical protein